MLYVKNDPSQAVKPVKQILKKKSVLKPPMQLRIFLQRSDFNFN